METRSLALWRGAMTHRSRITHTEREKESGDGTRDREKSLNQSVNSISHFVYFNLFKQIHANRWCQYGEDTMASTSNARMIGTIARNTHFFLTFLVCLFFSFSHRTYLRCECLSMHTNLFGRVATTRNEIRWSNCGEDIVSFSGVFRVSFNFVRLAHRI